MVPYPTKEEAEAASVRQLGVWMRFLSSPIGLEELEVMSIIMRRFKEAGGWKPSLSVQVGWRQ